MYSKGCHKRIFENLIKCSSKTTKKQLYPYKKLIIYHRFHINTNAINNKDKSFNLKAKRK